MLASICVSDGTISASFFLYSNSLATGLYSRYTESNSVSAPRGSTSSNVLMSFPDIHRSVSDVMCENGVVSVSRFLVRSRMLSFENFSASPVARLAPSTSMPLFARYNSSRVLTCASKFSTEVSRFDWTSSLRSFVSFDSPSIFSILFFPSHSSSRFSRPESSFPSMTLMRLAPRSIFRKSFRCLIPLMLLILFCAMYRSCKLGQSATGPMSRITL
mmetsp:Transcript_17944/g.38746  ORF Transcript_17944/g.38746 Transcript_17944/m.38746 type:complete len:216 (+) Transcript_17944:1038-1685(+)